MTLIDTLAVAFPYICVSIVHRNDVSTLRIFGAQTEAPSRHFIRGMSPERPSKCQNGN